MFTQRAVVVGQTVAREAVDEVATRAVVLTRVALTFVRLQEDRDDDDMNVTSVIGACDDDTGRSDIRSSTRGQR